VLSTRNAILPSSMTPRGDGVGTLRFPACGAKNPAHVSIDAPPSMPPNRGGIESQMPSIRPVVARGGTAHWISSLASLALESGHVHLPQELLLAAEAV
jgi:hypothetical protein